jgi:hypothetical protein
MPDQAPASPPPSTPAVPPSAVDALRDWIIRRQRWVWVTILLLYAAGFNGQWRLGPDTAVHMQIARELVRGQGYHHPTGLQATTNPGLPILLAASQYLFGEQTLWPPHLLMLGIGLLGLYLAYQLYLTHGDDPAAALACTALLAGSETYFRYNFYLLTDLPFVVSLLLMLLGFERLARQRGPMALNVLFIVLGIGAMTLFRSVALVVLAAVVAVMLWRLMVGPHRQRYALVLGVLLLAVLAARGIDPRLAHPGELVPDEIQIGQRLVDRFDWTVEKAFTVNLPRIFNEDLSETVFGLDLGPWLSVVLSVTLLTLTAAVSRHRPLWLMLMAAFLIQWIVFSSINRYMLVLLPLLVLGWWHGAAAVHRRLGPKRGGWVFAGMLALWVIPNLIAIGELVIDQRHLPFASHYEKGKYGALTRLAQQIHEHAQPDDLVIASSALELTWLADRAVVDESALPIRGKAAHRTIRTLQQAPRVLAVTPLRTRLKEQFTALGLSLGKKLTVVEQPESNRAWALHVVNVGDPGAALRSYKAANKAHADAGKMSGSPALPTPPTASEAPTPQATEQPAVDAGPAK